jgi:ABC-2 type transport system ATP-binding protein
MADFRLDAGRKYGQLSKGEKLKFALAFALSHRPKLLLLDEPAANFDRDFREMFRDILRKYTENGENMVVLSSHMTSDIDRAADYLLYLETGSQVMYGDIEYIRGKYRMAAGEEYRIRLLKDRVVHLEKGEFGTKALVRNSGKPFDPMLKVWEPSIEELMYHVAKRED